MKNITDTNLDKPLTKFEIYSWELKRFFGNIHLKIWYRFLCWYTKGGKLYIVKCDFGYSTNIEDLNTFPYKFVESRKHGITIL